MGSPEEVISVAELDRRLKRAVETVTGREWVEGEIASLKLAPSGHAYFSLKDEREDAIVECVMYRMNAQRARRHLSDGARVQLFGRATLWAPRGRLQLVGESLRPAGRGALLEALEQLKARLLAEGLFAPEKKRPLPSEPRVVGVVTSAIGAAFHDIRTVAFRRGGVRLVLSPALVQGEAAPDSIVRAIDLLERYPGLDAMIVGRGGGSNEDLMAFNDERVVRRVAAVRVPVVSAVGHEVDLTLCDLAADVRAATPSQAAELVIPDAGARRDLLDRQLRHLLRTMQGRLLEERSRVERLRAALSDPRFLIAERQQGLDELRARLERATTRSLARRRTLMVDAERRLAARHPRAVLAQARARLAPLEARLGAAAGADLARCRARSGELVARLSALSPLAVLARGYAIATLPDGRAVRAAAEVKAGDALSIRVSAGRIHARVTDTDSGEGAT
ncbi:MAG: exodeoxyribonuclease VII large subunit [Polyangiaceae bacterium]|nr:exodeoxyribonuclease VII large subunit [Myxococcales bacterium]MCC6899032.1 exodeoxyribonuclease VII large subunit [Polyangiaceae bacterium]